MIFNNIKDSEDPTPDQADTWIPLTRQVRAIMKESGNQ